MKRANAPRLPRADNLADALALAFDRAADAVTLWRTPQGFQANVRQSASNAWRVHIADQPADALMVALLGHTAPAAPGEVRYYDAAISAPKPRPGSLANAVAGLKDTYASVNATLRELDL